MSGLGWMFAGAALGVSGAVWWSRRPGAVIRAPGVEPMLLPDPALRWLADARGALGLWAATGGGEGSRSGSGCSRRGGFRRQR